MVGCFDIYHIFTLRKYNLAEQNTSFDLKVLKGVFYSNRINIFSPLCKFSVIDKLKNGNIYVYIYDTVNKVFFVIKNTVFLNLIDSNKIM